MLRYVVQRLARVPLIVLGVVTVLFIIFKLVPGDQATLAAGATATQAEIAAMRRSLGLDQPVMVQYGRYLAGLLHGDLGYSSTFRGNPFWPIADRIPATLRLMAAAIAVTIAVGIPAGVIAGACQDRWADHLISTIVVALLAAPNFWLGMVLMAVLSVQLGWLPSFGATGWAALVLPTIALAARLIALVARTTRGMVIEEMRKDYVRTAHAKGVAPGVVLTRHVLRNVLIPIITVIGLQAGYLLGGSVVIERLFVWPGIGDLMLTGVSGRDFTLVEGTALFFSVGFLLINIAVDLLYRVANPRLRHG
jgi:ABC-type dipeptide/oligopeptide/nickel transport system permease component